MCLGMFFLLFFLKGTRMKGVSNVILEPLWYFMLVLEVYLGIIFPVKLPKNPAPPKSRLLRNYFFLRTFP